jgi:hypothetical protein
VPDRRAAGVVVEHLRVGVPVAMHGGAVTGTGRPATISGWTARASARYSRACLLSTYVYSALSWQRPGAM